ncbi:MAG: DUF349 domain-containing protein [Gammaproteobacteria bacterium]|nr:DUF349 domain-containing protein [Gammaproteobacteria bacterium]
MKISRFLDASRPFEHEDPEVRRKAIERGDLTPDILESLAATDSDPRVRIAAIEHLDNAEFVLQLALASDGEQRRHAAVHWTRLICERDGAEAAVDALTAPAILTEVARTAPEVELRLRAIRRLDERDALLSLLSNDNHSRVHQACAQMIDDETTLESIRKRFMDKDKRVYQIAKDKLAALRALRDTVAKNREACEEVCAALEALADNEHEPTPERRLEVLSMRWVELVEADGEVAAEFVSRADSAMETCRARIEAGRQETAAKDEAADAVIAELRALTANLAASEAAWPTLSETLASLKARWPGNLPAEDERPSEYHRLMEQAEHAGSIFQRISAIDVDNADARTLRQTIDGFTWPDGWSEPAPASAIREKLQALEQSDEQAKAEREQRSETMRNQLKEFERKIDEGNLKGSNKAHSTIARALDEHATLLGGEFTEEFNRLTKRLDELRDWHRFATNPKRIELSEQMEALADDTETHPPQKAKQIKSLQDAWKALGPSDNREAQELWSRFKTASDKAYEPCAKFFKDQKAQRAENLKAREALCEELERFNTEHDWTDPDYKALGGLIARSMKAWREAGEVPRTRFKKISSRFNKALEPLQERLRAEHDRNQQKKSALIDRVKALADDTETPLPGLLEQAKQIQQEWQSIGPAERRKEQKLWKTFRQECDRLFARRDAERDAARAEANASRDQCSAVIDELKRRSQQGDIERGELRQFRTRFDEAARQAGKNAPRKAFHAAVKQAEKAIDQRAAADRTREIEEIRRRAALCRALEEGSMPPDAVDAEWDADIEVTAGVAERLDARRSGAPDLDSSTRQHNREAAALLCVRAEILAGLESPAEDQPLRMQHQVERLNKELSQGEKDHRPPGEQMRDLQIEWYCLGGLPADADDLYRRFAVAEQELKAG